MKGPKGDSGSGVGASGDYLPITGGMLSNNQPTILSLNNSADNTDHVDLAFFVKSVLKFHMAVYNSGVVNFWSDANNMSYLRFDAQSTLFGKPLVISTNFWPTINVVRPTYGQSAAIQLTNGNTDQKGILLEGMMSDSTGNNLKFQIRDRLANKNLFEVSLSQGSKISTSNRKVLGLNNIGENQTDVVVSGYINNSEFCQMVLRKRDDGTMFQIWDVGQEIPELFTVRPDLITYKRKKIMTENEVPFRFGIDDFGNYGYYRNDTGEFIKFEGGGSDEPDVPDAPEWIITERSNHGVYVSEDEILVGVYNTSGTEYTRTITLSLTVPEGEDVTGIFSLSSDSAAKIGVILDGAVLFNSYTTQAKEEAQKTLLSGTHTLKINVDNGSSAATWIVFKVPGKIEVEKYFEPISEWSVTGIETKIYDRGIYIVSDESYSSSAWAAQKFKFKAKSGSGSSGGIHVTLTYYSGLTVKSITAGSQAYVSNSGAYYFVSRSLSIVQGQENEIEVSYKETNSTYKGIACIDFAGLIPNYIEPITATEE